MRKILLSLVILTLPYLSRSGNISVEQAATVARNFYYERTNISNGLPLNTINIKNTRLALSSTAPAYYICEMLPVGFVVVSATNSTIPVLAYSFESNYAEEDSLHEGFKVWMNHYQQQIENAIQLNIEPISEITAEWERLLNPGFQIGTDLAKLQNVSPLLVSKWDQGNPYNGWCPADPVGPSGRCLTGCVATAMGQLLYYYRFPRQGQGSYSYVHPDYGTIAANFGATAYDWDGMPSTLLKRNDPVSELLFHQGVSVDMDYGPDASGMWNHKAAYSLKSYFRYGPETQYYFRDSVSIDWDSLLVSNLDQRKPLYYAGWAGVQSTSGHAFVCDGYQPGNYYHFNWGWGGSQDGYFYTANLTPGGNNFNFAQEVIPLFPDTLQNPYPANCQGSTVLNALRGSVEDGSGWYNYQENATCSWLISPEDEEYDSVKNVRITFVRFDTEAEGDTVYVYDGSSEAAPLLAALSGNSIPGIITASGNKVFVVFHSNSTVAKQGWQFDYESIFPVYCTGITTITSSSGSIEDGSGDKKYSANAMCRWKIMPADGMSLTLSFTSFETADSTDFVKVYDLQTQEVLGMFSGNQLPLPVTAQSGKMLILFMTNSSGNAQGWSADYHTSGVGINEIDTCGFATLLYPNPTSGVVTVEKYFKRSSEIMVRITDLKGVTLAMQNIKAVNGINKFTVDLSKLEGSAFLIKIEDDEPNELPKIVIKNK